MLRRCGYRVGSPPEKMIYLTFASLQKSTILLRKPLKTMRKSAVYEKFAKRERQNPYKSGN